MGCWKLGKQDSKTCEWVHTAGAPGTKKSECFLKVLKGQGPHSWTEASRVTVQQLEILGNSGHTNTLGNSSEIPHRGKQRNSHLLITPLGPRHTRAAAYQPGNIQKPSLHAIAQHKPLGVIVGPVKKGQEQVEKVLAVPADRPVNSIPLHQST